MDKKKTFLIIKLGEINMGYLNNDTVVVDAIMTKHGRWKLSRPGGQLGIEKFAVADDFIDYRLFNPQHSSGSAYFGEEIEKLPMVEAIPTDENCMKYKLTTVGQDIQFWPILENIETNYTIRHRNTPTTLTPHTRHLTSPETYTFKVPNVGLFDFSGTGNTLDSGIDYGSTHISFPAERGIPRAVKWSGRKTFEFYPSTLDSDVYASIEVEGETSGKTFTVEIKMTGPNYK